MARKALAGAVVLGLALTACGGSSSKDEGSGSTGGSSSGSGGGKKTAIILGTTDTVTSLDPAGAYDLPSWTVIYNVYQNLLKIKEGTSTPVPDAASKCDFTDPTTYTCTLNAGLKFSDGTPLTAKDVKASFDRMVKINDPAGSASLLANLKSTDATDDTTVTMHLDHADATFPFVLTTGAGAIVEAAKFPADKLLPSDQVVGSGPYKLTKYTAQQQAVFAVNDNYMGDDQLANNAFIIQYFNQASALKLAIEKGDVDVAYRSLAPTDIAALRKETDKGVQVVEGNGTEIRYLVMQLKQKPLDNKAVRQAIAQVIDRDAIAQNAYDGTVTPLYSMIPQGLAGAGQPFKDKYGAPDKAKAKALLDAAGVKTPVPVDLWYTPTHYGPNSVDELTEIKRQLDSSGLFTATVKSTEWQEYQKAYKAGTYPVFQLGWFPDFPDPDNYSAPFLDGKGGYFQNNYINPQLTALTAKEQGSTDAATRDATFAQIQKITAEDVPMIPVWQGKQIAAVRTGVTGVDKTFDPSFTFRFWLVGKS
ncbi:peptide/nickel transport system substrate-binding protein [Motilibacter peucedani]|uniref:Peptide/nickel transport system substrate-binding protein n=1 Tax=Motilibacter peucedani TaxID=598650 RepID=A0A420XTL7_9ACTN|nr:ABC transporter substrate-binding protein [Motilibacter peucedani]RKS80100.1 peptide/nickel transport system substrate-binding protein [Motilibacter peucedani]